MKFYSTNEFYPGLKIMQDGEPCLIIDNNFINPGKGQAFNRVRLRKLISCQIVERTYKSKYLAEAADVIDVRLSYLYNDKIFWYFIDNKSFEQLAANVKVIGDNAKWLTVQTECILTLWNKQPIAVIPPNFVELEIINTTDSNFKGNTISSNWKLATLATGATIKVPLFIRVGDMIKVDTRSGGYAARI